VKAKDRLGRWFLVREVLRGRAKYADNLNPGRWRWACVVKAMIVVLLGRERKEHPWDDWHEMDVDAVAAWGERTYTTFDGTFHEWTELQVGWPFWRSWHYHVIETGT
jgi:hypothetical protein